MLKSFPGLFLLMIFFLNNLDAQKSDIAVATKEASYVEGYNATAKGEFIMVKGNAGFAFRAYAAGPEDAPAGILVVPDFFGITPSTKESVERLGALGYRTIAVDLYHGKSASTNDSAQILMQAKDRKETDRILMSGIEYLKRPGRELAAVGFSAGGIDAMNASLMDPESFHATVIIYGGGYDKIEKDRIEKLKSPVLAITGALDEWPVQAALNFFANEKDKSFELFIYPNANHGYAQPFFLNGKNYDAEATRVTWKLTEDFLSRHLNNKSK